MTQLSKNERAQLERFRRIARQIRFASLMNRGGRYGPLPQWPREENQPAPMVLGDWEAFRSLAMSLRLAYQERETTALPRIRNILARGVTEDARPRVRELGVKWTEFLRISYLTVEGREYRARQILEAWMNSGVFHVDARRAPAVEDLSAFGPSLPGVIQLVVFGLSGLVLVADDLVAELLGEPLLPRYLVECAPEGTELRPGEWW